MANNYTQFSEIIDNATPEEIEWAKKRLAEMEVKFFESNGDAGWYFESEVHEKKHGGNDGPHIWVFAEEGGEPEHVAEFAQEFLKKFRPNACFSLTWASFCDKLRVGEFDGGGLFVTAEKIEWYLPFDFISQKTKEFEESKKSAS